MGLKEGAWRQHGWMIPPILCDWMCATTACEIGDFSRPFHSYELSILEWCRLLILARIARKETIMSIAPSFSNPLIGH